MLEKHFNGNINKELENEEEKKEQSLASRKRSESFDCHERCSSSFFLIYN